MKPGKLNKLLPFKKLLIFVIFICLFLQIIIISYNHFSGYYHVETIHEFLIRLIYSTTLSVPFGLLFVVSDLVLIRFLNNKLLWGKVMIQRIALQFSGTVLIGSFGALLVTILAHFINPYDNSLISVVITNILIASVINIMLMMILEAWIYFNERELAFNKATELENELTNIRFEVLKNQLNPHFMFNSLNVLSGLVSADPSKAQDFIDEFSAVYRYVLETIEKQVVKLDDEISFIRSYIFLQQIRYGNNLKIEMTIEASFLAGFIPPLSLQLVIENAIKHNLISDDSPLFIHIFTENEYVWIKNNIQPKYSKGTSTGLGIKNLIRRYSMVCENEPKFMIENSHYIAKLPVITND